MSTIAGMLALVLLIATPAFAQFTVATGVAEDATSANSQPKLGRDRHGTIYLAFVKPVGGFAQIFVASSADQGRTWRVQQISTGRADSRFPTLAVGEDGRVHVAWTQYDGGTGKVYYARFDGRRWTAPVRLSPGQAYAGVPAIAADRTGTPHVVWYGIRNQAPAIRTRHGSIYEILYSRVFEKRWTQPEIISPGIPDSINPTLGIDGQGRLHSAWYQFDARVYQVRYTERDRVWNQPKQISSGGDDAAAVAMAAVPDGSVYLAWERRESGGVSIYFAERHARWSGQQPIASPVREASNPSIAVDDGKRVYVVWESDGQLHLKRRDRQWLGTERLSTEGKNSYPIVSSNGSVVDLMWTQQIGGSERRLRFATIAGTAAAQPFAARILWGAVILVLILAAALVRWRRRDRVAGTQKA